MAIKNAFNEPLYTTAEELQKRKDAEIGRAHV